MIGMKIHLNGDNCWPDLIEKREVDKVIDAMNGKGELSLAVLDAGMSSGQPSVTLRIDLPDGRVVLSETSARLFCTAARMISTKFPHLFRDN